MAERALQRQHCPGENVAVPRLDGDAEPESNHVRSATSGGLLSVPASEATSRSGWGFAQVVEPVLDAGITDDHNPQSGDVFPQRLANRPGGDDLQGIVLGRGVGMVVAGEDMRHAILPEQIEVATPLGKGQVVVSRRLVDALNEPGVVLEDDHVRHPFPLGFLQFGFQPGLLLLGLLRGALGGLNEPGIEHQPHQRTAAEGIMVGTEPGHVRRDAFRRRVVSDVVVARQLVQRDGAVELGGNPQILVHLRLVARLVDQVARDDHEGRFEAVGRGDGKLEIGRLLLEVGVRGVHPELRVAELDEEQGLGSLGPRQAENQQAGPGNPAQWLRQAGIAER